MADDLTDDEVIPEHDPPLRPAGTEVGEEPEDKPAPPKKETQTEADWVASLDDDELKAYATSKGFKTVGDLVKSYREAESGLGRERSRAEKAERERQQVVEMMEKATIAATGREPNQADQYQIQRVADGMEAGEITYAQGFDYLMNQVIPDMIDRRAQELVRPVAVKTQAREMDEAAAQMEATYPEFRELLPEVLDLIKGDPSEYDTSAKGMKRAFAQVKADRDAKMAEQRRRTTRAETVDRSSLGVDTKSAADALRERIAGVVQTVDDGI